MPGEINDIVANVIKIRDRVLDIRLRKCCLRSLSLFLMRPIIHELFGPLHGGISQIRGIQNLKRSEMFTNLPRCITPLGRIVLVCLERASILQLVQVVIKIILLELGDSIFDRLATVLRRDVIPTLGVIVVVRRRESVILSHLDLPFMCAQSVRRAIPQWLHQRRTPLP